MVRHTSKLFLDSDKRSQVSHCDVEMTPGKSSCWVTWGIEQKIPIGYCEKCVKKHFSGIFSTLFASELDTW